MGNYTSQYESADLSEIAIDFIAGYGVQIIEFVAIIALVTLAVWGYARWKKR